MSASRKRRMLVDPTALDVVEPRVRECVVQTRVRETPAAGQLRKGDVTRGDKLAHLQRRGTGAYVQDIRSRVGTDQALRARTAGRSAGVGTRRALAGSATTATVFPVMSKNSTE
jgi:hypothetical protein